MRQRCAIGPSTLPNADYKSRSQAIASIAEKFGCSRATLRDWVNRLAVEDGERDGLTQSEREELKALQRENRELRQANEILRKGEAIVRHWSEELPVVAPLVRAPLATDERFFRSGGPRPPTEEMIMFIDEFGMRPPLVRGPCRTRGVWRRGDLQGERVNATGPRDPANADRAVHLSPPPSGQARPVQRVPAGAARRGTRPEDQDLLGGQRQALRGRQSLV